MALTRSRHKAPRGPYTGPVSAEIYLVVSRAWEHGIAVSSDLARHYAPEVALASSMGWISTVSLDGTQGLRTWNVTAEGVSALEHHRKEAEP